MNMLTVMLQAQGGGDLSFILMMVAIFAIMYFFMIRHRTRSRKKLLTSVRIWK